MKPLPTPAAYPVYVEAGALDRIGTLVRRHLTGRRIVVIADTTVAALYADRVLAALASPSDRPARPGPPALFTFPPGEPHKTRETWARLTDELLALGAGRDTAIVALGGGVTGDLAGFVAATYLRGIPVLQLPTTLLAMVDSAIGGKTGVDTAAGKNLVGAFHEPAAVVIDPLVLATLPDREYRGGLAEAVKHGLMLDAAYFEWIEAEAAALGARDVGTIATLIRRSVELKAGVVAEDARDAGRRAVLNAGHTVAHAIEQASGWSVAHGDAVALGLIAETAIAVTAGRFDGRDAARVRGVLVRLGLPVTLDAAGAPGLAVERVVEPMRSDKKNHGEYAGAVRFGFPDAIGHAAPDSDSWTTAIPVQAVLEGLRASTIGHPAADDRAPAAGV